MRGAAVFLASIALWGAAASGPAEAIHVAGDPVVTIEPEYVKRLLDNGEHPTFFDLRSGEEFKKGRKPGARSLPLLEIRRRIAEVPKTGRVILYCDCPALDLQEAYYFLRAPGLSEH